MSKVYCCNCKWFETDADGYGDGICVRKTGKIITDYIHGDYPERKPSRVGDFDYPNKKDTNGCTYYVRSWWKFWIKEQENE